MSGQKLLKGLLATPVLVPGVFRHAEVVSRDVAWTFEDVGSASYGLDALHSTDAGLGANLDSQDLTLRFQADNGQNTATVRGSMPRSYPLDVCTSRIPGDIDGDCVVDITDLNILIDHRLEDTIRSSGK